MIKNICLRLFVIIMGYAACSAQIVTEAKSVSPIQLIATPEKFDGKKVWTEGHLLLNQGSLYLFISSEDARLRRYRNAIDITGFSKEFDKNINVPALSDKPVELTGIFRYREGRMATVGALDQVSGMSLAPILRVPDGKW